MPPPARATVEEIEDEDDPYVPFQPEASQAGSNRPSQTSTSGSRSTPAASTSSSASPSSAFTGRTSAPSSSGSQSASRGTTYAQNQTASSIYDQSPSAGTQGSFPREGGDEEPLFGGRPFRDSHDTSSADPSSSSTDPARATDKEYLYALLNVPTDASIEAIKDAYRSLAVVLHPDKHKDASRKASAESRFREVQRAYEILSDPEKRTIYDYFGEEGLKSTWSLAVRGRSPQEMQAEFERERRRKQLADAEALVKSKGDFTAHIDASALFARSSRIPRRPPQQKRGGVNGGKEAQSGRGAGLVGAPTAPFLRSVTFADRVSSIGCTQLVGKHGFETQITSTTSATFSGQMVSRNGLGGGNLVGTLKTHWSPRLFTDITLSFLRPQIITTKGQYTVDANSFFSWQATLQTLMMPPSFNVTYGQRLSSKSTLTGFTTFRSGTYSILGWGKELGETMAKREPAAVSAGLTKQMDEGRGWTAQTSISTVDHNISVDYATMVLGGLKVRTGFNLGTGSGVSAFTSAERRLTENVRLSLGLNFGLPVGGLTLRVKVNRLGQKILLPIMLSREFRSDLVVMFAVVPAATYTALHYGYLEPRKRKRLRNRLGELRRQNRDLILERREAALQAVEVLRDQAVKKANTEINRSGLVILEAYYGNISSFPPSKSIHLRRAAQVESLAQQIWSSDNNAPRTETEIEVDLTKERYWDVRVAVQALVTKGQLIIPGNRSKSNLLGFHDPVMGEKKHLQIVYAFRGQIHNVVVDDWKEVAMPMRIHQLS